MECISHTAAAQEAAYKRSCACSFDDAGIKKDVLVSGCHAAQVDAACALTHKWHKVQFKSTFASQLLMGRLKQLLRLAMNRHAEIPEAIRKAIKSAADVSFSGTGEFEMTDFPFEPVNHPLRTFRPLPNVPSIPSHKRFLLDTATRTSLEGATLRGNGKKRDSKLFSFLGAWLEGLSDDLSANVSESSCAADARRGWFQGGQRGRQGRQVWRARWWAWVPGKRA
eukprot:707958-Pelagomonas_calceolata.AAC.3